MNRQAYGGIFQMPWINQSFYIIPIIGVYPMILGIVYHIFSFFKGCCPLLPTLGRSWRPRQKRRFRNFAKEMLQTNYFAMTWWHSSKPNKELKRENALCTSFVRTKKAREVKRSQEVFHFLNRLALRPPKRTPRYTETPPSSMFPSSRTLPGPTSFSAASEKIS